MVISGVKYKMVMLGTTYAIPLESTPVSVHRKATRLVVSQDSTGKTPSTAGTRIGNLSERSPQPEMSWVVPENGGIPGSLEVPVLQNSRVTQSQFKKY